MPLDRDSCDVFTSQYKVCEVEVCVGKTVGSPLRASHARRVLVWTVFLRFLDVSLPYLTVSPRISLHLLASPRICPYLPVSARICPYLPVSRISWYLPVSPGRYLPVSGIPPYPAISRRGYREKNRPHQGCGNQLVWAQNQPNRQITWKTPGIPGKYPFCPVSSVSPQILPQTSSKTQSGKLETVWNANESLDRADCAIGCRLGRATLSV